MRGLLLAGKAEVVLGVSLVTRHRTVRLVGVLAGTIVMASAAVGPGGSATVGSLLVVAGSLAAVGGSRIFAPGPALFAVRCAASPWWLGPVCRLAGLVLVMAAGVGVGAVALVLPAQGWATALRAGLAASLSGAALAGATAAVAPLVGATGAGTIGMIAAWLGGITPSGVAALLAPSPLLVGPAVLCWNALPLSWRAARWHAQGTGTDALVLAVWVGLGVLGAAWAIAASHRGDGRRAEDE